MKSRPITQSRSRAASSPTDDAEARRRQFLSEIVDKLRQRLEVASDGSPKERWTRDRLVKELSVATLETGNAALVGTWQEFAQWSQATFDAASKDEKKEELGTSVAGGAIGSWQTWQKIAPGWQLAFDDGAIEGEMPDATGARRTVKAKLHVSEERSGVIMLHAAITIDGNPVPTRQSDPYARIATRGAGGWRQELLEWFGRFLDSLPAMRLGAAREALRQKRQPWEIISILFGLMGCTLGYAYYRATHHIRFVGEPMATIWRDASRAPTIAHAGCWESKGREPIQSFRIIRDGEDVTDGSHLWNDRRGNEPTYCFEDRTIIPGEKYTYRVALGGGVRRKISGPMEVCLPCAQERQQQLDRGEPIILRRGSATSATDAPRYAYVNEPRRFEPPFARLDQDGPRVDPSSLSDKAADQALVSADFGDAHRATVPFDRIVHTYTTVGKRTVQLVGLGRYKGNRSTIEIEVIDPPQGSNGAVELIYAPLPPRAVVIDARRGDPPPVTIYTRANTDLEIQFFLGEETIQRLNQLGGTTTYVPESGADPVAGQTPAGSMAGRDALSNRMRLPTGTHRGVFHIADGSGIRLLSVYVSVHSLGQATSGSMPSAEKNAVR